MAENVNIEKTSIVRRITGCILLCGILPFVFTCLNLARAISVTFVAAIIQEENAQETPVIMLLVNNNGTNNFKFKTRQGATPKVQPNGAALPP